MGKTRFLRLGNVYGGTHLEVEMSDVVIVEMFDAPEDLSDEGRGLLLPQVVLLGDVVKELASRHPGENTVKRHK